MNSDPTTPNERSHQGSAAVPYWICGIAAILFLASIARFTPNIPSWDDYADLDWILRLREASGAWLWTGLFEPHNEHRVVVLHLLTFIFGANFQLAAVIGAGFSVAAVFVIFQSQLPRIRTFPSTERQSRWIAISIALSISLVLYSPKHWEDSYWSATAATVLPGLAFAICSLLLLDRFEKSDGLGAFFTAIAAALGSSLCQTNGFLVWPIGALLIALSPRDSTRHVRLIIWLLFSAATIWIFFFLWPPEALIAKSRSADATRIIAAIPYFIRVVGLGLDGVSGYLVAGTVLALAAYSTIRHYKRSLGLFGIMLFGLGSVAMLSIARADLPLGTAGSPRYSLYAATILLSSTLMVALNTSRRISGAMLMLALSTAYFALGVSVGVPALVDRAGRVESQIRIVESSTGQERYSSLFVPPEQFGRISENLNRASTLGIFTLPRRVSVRTMPRLLFSQPVLPAVRYGGAIDGAPVSDRTLSLVGWHMLPINGSSLVIYISGTPTPQFSSYAILERRDVAKATNSPALVLSGFEITLQFDDAASATNARATAIITACDGQECWQIPRAAWRS